MVIVGSILGIENSQAWGCVLGLEMLSFGNLIFFIISLVLLLKAYKSDNQKTAILFLAIETGIWIIKYILYKGGYVTEYGGTPNSINVVYDFIAIGSRTFLLLVYAANLRNALLPAILSSILIVAVKINLFALPLFTQKMWEIEEKNSIIRRTELIGKYEGKIYQFSDSLTDQIKIVIDTTHLKIIEDSPFALMEKYRLEMYSQNNGSIGNNEQMFDIEIEKLNNDSLVFYLVDMLNKQYLVRMKHER
jgi:hypothetical protein